MKVNKKYKYVETIKNRPATKKEIKEYIELQEKLKKPTLYLTEQIIKN